MSQRFDVVVLGAGSGGYTAAVRAAQLGKSVAIVEERYWGGVCLNIGCIPSKSLLRNAEIANLLRHDSETFGIHSDAAITVDYQAAYERSRAVVDGRVRGVRFLMRKNKITEIEGHGTFLDAHRLVVPDAVDPEHRLLEFENCIVATGATPRLLPGTSRSARVLTYEDVVLAQDVPTSILIIGGGAIGVELGYLLHAFGTDVTIIEALDRLVPTEDAEVSRELQRRFARGGIHVLTSARVEALAEVENGVRVTVHVDEEAAPRTLMVAQVLQSIGFTPTVTGYGLETTGVLLTQAGAIEVDDRSRTSVEHLFAIGDVTGKKMLAHVAEAMGIIAAETLAKAETIPLDVDMVPRATFCHPQIASFGYTEQQALEQGLDVQIAKFPFAANGKASGIADTAGFVKVLCDTTHGELLGAHLIGPDVAELLSDLTLAQQWDLTVHEVARNIHIHPTLGEAVKEAVHGLAGHMINL